MLIDVKIQKNGTVVIAAPDGSVFTFELDTSGKTGDETPQKAGEKTLQKIGRTVLEILSDPEQPQVQVQQVATRAPAAQAENVETHLRRGLDSILPGASGIIDFLQDISVNGPDKDSEKD